MTMHNAPERFPFLVSVLSDPAPHTEEPHLEYSFSLLATDIKTAIEMARGRVDEEMPHHWSSYDIVVKEAECRDVTMRWWSLCDSTEYPFDACQINVEMCLIHWAHGNETVYMSLEEVVDNPDLALSEASNHQS